MITKKIEYFRYDKLETGILIENKPYLLTVGDKNALREVRTSEDHKALSRKLRDTLTYKKGVIESQKLSVIKEISDSLKSFFIDSVDITEDINHLEVFLNPSELALIPFELLLDENDTPRFISKRNGGQLLTRNDRNAKDLNKNIPETPRVLFAYVTPPYNKTDVLFKEVPYKFHKTAIKSALKNRGGEERLKVLENPTFDQFKSTILQAAAEKDQYTHIHLLAHGLLRLDKDHPSEFEYGVAFNTEKVDPKNYKSTSAEEIKSIFEGLSSKDLPYLVNYMICDGANFTNGALPDRNPLQVTFNLGVPIVIGSQFPLSMEGSTMVTKSLYKRLFRGDDIRQILLDIRTDLYNKKPHKDSHDWISLLSYMNLSSAYEYELLNHKTKCQLAILNNIRDSANKETIFENNNDFKRVKYQIRESIKVLNKEVTEIQEKKVKEKEFLEYAGLLGSAYKRLTEVELKEGNILDSDTSNNQLEYLNEAKEWYKKAAEKNRSHHWSIVQYLSLKTVLEGHLNEDDLDFWYAARGAAKNEITPNATWPYGTLIELYVLNPNTVTDSHRDEILEFALELTKNAKKLGKKEHVNSTYLQIERYSNWWNNSNFRIPENILANEQDFIKKILSFLVY
ncbi:CHAT domain-containing protein [Flagellimonas algicola]|uniref:CHAT domain-containing protein n=1 Tax=Flagellimonas algicola TaxID=2583815 RepID=A0ABY2WRW0_9FLAO|nr:CHAT domain-containing protein [Allomuricauda algicola]TMU57475.1 CHAT domain-containing protein [Allomuricauda algicola]